MKSQSDIERLLVNIPLRNLPLEREAALLEALLRSSAARVRPAKSGIRLLPAAVAALVIAAGGFYCGLLLKPHSGPAAAPVYSEREDAPPQSGPRFVLVDTPMFSRSTPAHPLDLSQWRVDASIASDLSGENP